MKMKKEVIERKSDCCHTGRYHPAATYAVGAL